VTDAQSIQGKSCFYVDVPAIGNRCEVLVTDIATFDGSYCIKYAVDAKQLVDAFLITVRQILRKIADGPVDDDRP